MEQSTMSHIRAIGHGKANVTPLALTIGLLLAAKSPAGQAASLIGGGTLPNATRFSIASAVSADGSVVVGEAGNAARWTAAGPVTLGIPASTAYGVSADGSVIVGEFVNGGHGEAFRWTSGGYVGLGTAGGFLNSAAYAVSGDGGTVVGGLYGGVPGEISRAFVWTAGGGMTALPHLAGGDWATANGVSQNGSVIVGDDRVAGVIQAFRYTQAGGIQGLGFLTPGPTFSTASAVSADGQVIVGGASTPLGNFEAFRWTSAGGMTSLGTVPGYTDTFASGVSGDGSVIVGWTNGGGQTAFRWTQATGIRSVSSLLADSGVNIGSWRLERARAVSADGTTVVGEGHNPNDQAEAFIVRFGASAGGGSGGGAALVSLRDFSASAASLGAVSHLPGKIGRVAATQALPGLSGLQGFSIAPTYSHIDGSRGDMGGVTVTWRQPGYAIAGHSGALSATTSPLHDGGRAEYLGWWMGASASLDLAHLLDLPIIQGLELDGGVRGGVYDTTVHRNYLNGVTPETARGGTDTHELTAITRLGWRFALTGTVQAIPHVQWMYNRTAVDGYTETTGALAGRVSAQKRDNHEAGVGGTLAWQVHPDVNLRARYSHHFLHNDTGAPVGVTVPGLGTFAAPGAKFGEKWHEYSLGGDWAINKTTRLQASVAATSGSGYPENWSTGVALNFGF